MARSLRSLSLLVTASVLFAAILAAVAPVTTSNAAAAAAAPVPEIFNPQLEQAVTEGVSGYSKRVILNFGRTGDLSTASSVRFTLVDETATRGSDYTAATYSKVLRFPVGTYFVRVNLNVRGDAIVEPDETFSWHLSDPTGATIRDGHADGSVVILNDDSAVPSTFSVADTGPYTHENNQNPSQAVFVVTRTGSTAKTAQVKITTINGTARAPGDYAAKRSTLYFGVGRATALLRVPIKNDLVPEPTETFSVQLSAPVRGTIADGTAIGTIEDDDSNDPPEIVTSDGLASETSNWRTVTIYVYREGDLRVTSTVTYTTSDGTAHAPGDYTAKTGKVTFRPGEATKSVTVSIKDDEVPEPREDFFVTFSNPSAGTTISDPISRIEFGPDYD